MANFGKMEFAYSARRPDGTTLRQHIEAAISAKIVAPDVIAYQNRPKLKADIAHVWAYFIELHSRRQHNNGPQKLTYAEIREWKQEEGRSLQPWERKAIFRLDDLYIESVLEAERLAREANAKK